jgi:hypothetical protein
MVQQFVYYRFFDSNCDEEMNVDRDGIVVLLRGIAI